ncbi:MAG: glucose 1-dehydrogenase [Herpetosiphonaceae bacterium]|nr:glucose 1-dehydrogenase [Herpetosiphonaceae bacterium]
MDKNVLTTKPILDRMRLDGRVALVTGGGQGIGRAFAHALGEAGAAVAIVDVAADRAETVVGELHAKGIDSLALTCDVTKVAPVHDMVAAVLARWGSLTIAVNNAGIGRWADAETLTEEHWDAVMNLNLKGVFLCAQAVAAPMLEAGYGKIINTASMSAHIVNRPQHQVPYNTSKAGVLHLTRSLAAEWAPRGIRVNSISPGYMRTALLETLLETPESRHLGPQWIDMTPLGRLGEVTDLQGAVVYLAAEASDFMTGNDLVIDGGYGLW